MTNTTMRQQRDDLVGARLDEHDGAARAGEPQQHAAQPLGGNPQARRGGAATASVERWRGGCARSSVGVLGLEQRERRHRQDVEVEQHRPVLDVVEVVLDAALDLLVACRSRRASR